MREQEENNFRVYSYVDSPFTLFGVSMDECLILMVGLLMFFYAIISAHLKLGFISMVGVMIGFFTWRRTKKQMKGFSIMSWVNWNFCFSGEQVKNSLPESHKRKWSA